MSIVDKSVGIYAELAAAGFAVDRVGELRRWPDYRAAIPILLRWLPHVEDRYLRWAIVAALGVCWAKPAAAPALIDLFRRTPFDDIGFKWAIGAALAEVVDDSVFEDLVPLVCDPRHGHARQMVVRALGQMRHPRAVAVLVALLDDADKEIVEQALLALGRLKAEPARACIEPFLTHTDRWVCRAARLALASTDSPPDRAARVETAHTVCGRDARAAWAAGQPRQLRPRGRDLFPTWEGLCV